MESQASDHAQLERVWNSLRDELRRMGADLQTAEDIAQDSWLISLRDPPQERGRFRGWLHIVAIRMWRRSLVRDAERKHRELTSARVRHAERAEAQAPSGERSPLYRFVEELAEPYRTTVLLRYFEGLEVGEIAERLSLPIGTVRTRLKRALRQLRLRCGRHPERLVSTLPLVAWLLRARDRIAERTPWRLAGGAGFATATLLAVGLLTVERHDVARPMARLALAERPSEAREDDGADLHVVDVAPDEREEHVEAPASNTPRGHRTGTVRSPDGEPVAGALVHAGDALGLGAVSTTVSDERGRYELEAEAGLLWATHADWCESTRVYVLSLSAGAEADLVLGATRGRVAVEVVSATGEPVAGAQLLFDPASHARQTTTPLGRLELQRPPAGATTGEDGRCSLLFPEDSDTVLLVLAGERPGYRRSLPTPAAGGSLRIELPPPGSLTGTCRDEAGQLLPGARVTVSQLHGLLERQATTDAEGTFRVEGLAPGQFFVRAREAGAGRISAAFTGILEAGEDRHLGLELTERYSILGRVVDARGPVAGASVELRILNVSPALSAVRVERSDEQGRFVFGGCDLTLAHDLLVFLPGASEPCLGVEQLRPGRGEATYVVPQAADAELAPLELEFFGARLPRLVELRRSLPALSLVLEPLTPGSGSFRSEPLPAGPYQVFAWHPDLGTWMAPAVEHDLRRAHELDVALPATLAVELDLHDGVTPESLEVSVTTPSFHRNGLGPFGTSDSSRLLEWSESRGAFVASLMPGTYPLRVHGPGVADLQETVVLDPGVHERRRMATGRGIEVTLLFEALVREPGRELGHALKPHESLLLDVLTATGASRLELLFKDQRRVENGFELDVRLPETTVELHARTQTVNPLASREGHCVLEPDALSSAEGQPRIRIPLELVKVQEASASR